MPIKFDVNHAQTYYRAKWQGQITDEDLINAYKAFFAGQEWVPGYNSVVDMSELDATALTTGGVRALASLVKTTFEPHNIHPKIAVYAPYDLPYGLSRMYSVEVNTFETHRTFRDMEELFEWLRSSSEE